MRINFTFILLFFTIIFQAQIISGNIWNENDKPISDVNIYLDGSKIHTLSTNDGSFSIDIQNQKNSNLIFQKDGFQTNIIKASDAVGKKVKVVLNKIQDIEEVVLIPYTDEAYKNYIQYFLNQFIGSDQSNVRIKNQKTLKFSYDKKNKILKVKAPNTLIIENKYLGYIVQYNLISFESNFVNGNLSYLGTSFFKETNNKNEIKTNRLNAYYGSTMHFIRSVYANKVAEEGFWANHIIQMRNPKYPTDEELEKLEDYRVLMKNSATINIPEDIGAIMKKKRESQYVKAVKAVKLSTASFTKKEGEKLYLTFPDILQVNYNKYYFTNKKSEFIKAKNPIIQSSYIYLEGNIFEIYADGNTSEPDLMLVEGEFTNNKIGKLLPSDYIPEY